MKVIKNLQKKEMKRNKTVSISLLTIMLTSMQFCYSQDKFKIPLDLYEKHQDVETGNNYLSTKLIIDNNYLILNLKNNTNDTITIVGYFTLEWPKKGSFLLFCLSDSLLREHSNENGFNLNDTSCYYYSSMFVSHLKLVESAISFDKLFFCKDEDSCLVSIYPKQDLKIPISYYSINTYMFIRFQSMICVKRKWFWIQKETNSIFMPKCNNKR
jgi:hypothetical protein